MTALGVEGIRVSFGDILALDDVSLEVPGGEVTAVVGGDGAGKSTLLRVLAGRVRVSSGLVHSLDRADIGYQPATSGVWGNLSVRENMEFVGRAYGMSGRAIRSRGDELLERAGLADARARLGSALSGGMRQKLGFLLAMLHDPRLVLLDEPSTGVDPVSRVELWRLVSRVAADGAAVVITTTYLDEAQRAASVVALDTGRVLAAGTPDTIIASIPGTVTSLADPEVPRPGSWRRGAARHLWVPAAETPEGAMPIQSPDLEDALISLTMSSRGADLSPGNPVPRHAVGSATGGPHPERRAGIEPGTPLAAGRHVTRRFGATVAADDVSLDVRAGEVVGLIGANGAGKTTFLRCLIGLDRQDDGEVELFGTAPDADSRRRLGYVPQGLGLSKTISVAENAEFFSRVYATPGRSLPAGLSDVPNRLVGDIGLGRQRQLAFALALAHDPDLLILDEPTSGVDPLSRAGLWDTIHAQADAGRGVLVTTHYLQEAEQCTRLALMAHGKVLAVGTVNDLIGDVSAVEVRTQRWQDAFTALSDAGLPTMLSGRTVRVAGVDVDRVRDALGDISATVAQVAPTLEETMVLLET